MPPAGVLGQVALALGRGVADMGDRLTDITVRDYFARLGVAFGASLTQNAPVRVARAACEIAASEVREALAEFAAADSDATAWAKLAIMLDAIASAKEPLVMLEQALVAERANLAPVAESDVLVFADGLANRILEDVVVREMERWHDVSAWLTILAVLDYHFDPGRPGDATRPGHLIRRLRIDRLGQLLISPATYFTDVLFAVDAFAEDGIVDRISNGFALSGEPLFDVAGATDRRSNRLLDVGRATAPASGIDVLSSFPLMSRVEFTFPVAPQWTARIQLAGPVGAGMGVRWEPPLRLSLLSGSSQAAFDLVLSQTPAPGAPAIRVIGTDSARLEAAEVGLGFGVAIAPPGQSNGDVHFQTLVKKARLVFDTSDAGPLLEHLASDIEIDAAFDATMMWSSSRGLSFEGSGGAEVVFSTNASFGPLTLKAIRLKVTPLTKGVSASAGVDASLQLGPVVMDLDMGLELAVAVPEEGPRNLGFARGTFDVLPPSRIGISIDAGPVGGGGVLQIEDAGRYSGGLNLRIYEITVTAFGIIDTRLPDGGRAFSFVILISAEFQPIQLGLGFTLNGVGGLLGINRTVSAEGLERAFTNKGLQDILFPRNVVQRAPEIIEALQTVFPPAEDHQVFGPMAKIGWGTPTLVTADLALLLNLPERVLRVLGLVRADLPRKRQDQDRALVSLRMAVRGELDFPNKRFALDAFLHDSTVGGFVVSGDMALRLSWGDRPNFLLSLGGFHKDYTPPPSFPALNLLAVELGINGNPTITLSGYLAVTSNTVQVGGSLRFVASKAHFEIGASVSADAIFVFSPFSFTATLDADVHLTFHGVGFTVRLHGKLSGPSPWRIEAKVCASLWFVSACLPFSETIGTPEEDALPSLDPWLGSLEPPPATKSVIGLQESLEDPRNWAPLPGAGSVAVVSRADPPLVDGAQVTAVDPLDAITVHQRVVPLETHPDAPITRFGPVTSSGTPRYHLETATMGRAEHPLSSNANITDYFAPGQFFELDQKKVFSAPAFERRPAGYTFEVNGDLRFGSTETESAVTFQTFVIDTKRPVRRPDLDRRLDLDLLNGMLRTGPAAVGGVTFRGEGAFLDPLAGPRFGLKDPTYVVTDRIAQQPAGVVDTPVSKTEALIILESHLAQNPADRGRLQISRAEALVSP